MAFRWRCEFAIGNAFSLIRKKMCLICVLLQFGAQI